MGAPQHIAIIMDGNGRWASQHHLPRIQGHRKGVQAVRNSIKYCAEIGVKSLTLFAFSSENKHRPKKEVSLLFELFLSALQQETHKLNKHNIQLKIIGDLSFFPPEIQKTAATAQTLLSKNTGLTLTIAANYGGQWDITRAARNLAKACMAGDITPDEIEIETFAKYLSNAEQAPVDLLIRTSGEFRMSNFLLWDIAYSELYFTKTLWPDFDTGEMDRAIEEFNTRHRRFGQHEESTC